MRKILGIILSAVLTVSAFSFTAMANDEIKVVVNGEEIDFSGDQAPVIQNGRTLVPFRAVFEKMGAEVKWFADTQLCEATYGSMTVSTKIGENIVSIGEIATVETDVPAQIINGRTMVPLRVLSESIGASVNWDNDSRTVIVNTPGGVSNSGNLSSEIKTYDNNFKLDDGTVVITGTVEYPEFNGTEDFIPSLNTQLYNSARKAVDSFVNSYGDLAVSAYNNATEHLFEPPYNMYGMCEVTKEGNVVVITVNYTEVKYGEEDLNYSDVIKIDMTTGMPVL